MTADERLFSLTVNRFIKLPALLLALAASPALAVDVRVCTDLGAIDLSLDEQRAPRHTANFLRYAESGFYSGTVIHRVVPGSMAQGGSFDLNLERRAAGNPVINESANGLSNLRGTIAASRSDDPNSATSQFFFNLTDNTHLDAQPGVPGYTVFGRVTAGLEVLDRIAASPTGRVSGLDDVPRPLIEVQSIVELDRAPVFGVSIEQDPASLANGLELARARGDAAGILDAIDQFRQSCVALNAEQQLAEAEAAITLGRADRARYTLEHLLAKIADFAPEAGAARRLLARLAEPVRQRSADELIGHCRTPVAPSIPDGRLAQQITMQEIEGAVRRYRQLGELYLSCVTQRLGRSDLEPAERADVIRRHNAFAVELTAVLVRFNQAVRDFKAAAVGSLTPSLN